MLSRFSKNLVALGTNARIGPTPNLVQKRFSGHNNMNIRPSNYGISFLKDTMHLYVILTAIPIAVITTIINIRANPELSEVPEGYEPRHWEYYKHPITRFIARYFNTPMELEHELETALFEFISESDITRKILTKVHKTMAFYDDHRSQSFLPFYGEYYRRGRDETFYRTGFVSTVEGHHYDRAYDLSEQPTVPTQGFVPNDNND